MIWKIKFFIVVDTTHKDHTSPTNVNKPHANFESFFA